MHPSPLEKPIKEQSIITGGNILPVFTGTPAGTIMVLICLDALVVDINTVLLQQGIPDIDVVCVPAMQPVPSTHHARLGAALMVAERSYFVLYANAVVPPGFAGGSAVLARPTKGTDLEYLHQHLTDGDPHTKLIEMPSCAKQLIVSLDLTKKNPPRIRAPSDDHNVKLVYKDFHYVPDLRAYRTGGDAYVPLPIKMIAFDFDGSLSRGTTFSWELLWQSCGAASARRDEYRHEYLQRVAQYPDRRQELYASWCAKCTDAFREQHVTEAALVELASQIHATRNVAEALTTLKRQGYYLMLVSGAIDIFPRVILGEALLRLFNETYWNEATFSADGYLKAIVPTVFDYEGKIDAVQRACERHNWELSQVACVGDEYNDRPLLTRIYAEGGLAIAYGEAPPFSSDEVSRLVREDDLLQIVEIVKGRVQRARIREGTAKWLESRFEVSPSEARPTLRAARATLTTVIRELVAASPSTIQLYPLLRHDAAHRAAMRTTIAHLLNPNVYPCSHLAAVAFVADCATEVHDIGMLLSGDLYIPGSGLYSRAEQERLIRRRHNRVAARMLSEVASGKHDNVIRACASRGEDVGDISALITTLRDVCRLLAPICAFHDTDTSDGRTFHSEVDTARDKITTFQLTEGDIEYVRACICLADRIDRHWKRFVDKGAARATAEAWRRRPSTEDAHVVVDCVCFKKVQVTINQQRSLHLHFTIGSYDDEDLDRIVGETAVRRVAELCRGRRAWYVNKIEELATVALEGC